MEPLEGSQIWQTYQDLQKYINEYNKYDMDLDTITMGAPIHLAEGPFITTLWGKAVLYDTLENHTNSNKVASYIYNSLLTTYTCNIRKMDVVRGIDYKSFIISANEIQSQHINTKDKTISIPIKAFNGKSLLTLDTPPTSAPDSTTRYYFILLQSAKDPNIVQPIRIWQETRTLELKSMLTSQVLTNEHWEVKIDQGETLTKYINHQHTGKDITIPIVRSLYNTATGVSISQRVTGSINSITNDPTIGVQYTSSLGDLGDWITKLNL